jgi:hypothetical protein
MFRGKMRNVFFVGERNFEDYDFLFCFVFTAPSRVPRATPSRLRGKINIKKVSKNE